MQVNVRSAKRKREKLWSDAQLSLQLDLEAARMSHEHSQFKVGNSQSEAFKKN